MKKLTFFVLFMLLPSCNILKENAELRKENAELKDLIRTFYYENFHGKDYENILDTAKMERK